MIDNRPGGSGNIAAETVAHATPDGYTLLMGNNGLLATNQSLFRKINFDGAKDFAPISLIGSQPNILVVSPKLAITNMGELIAYAKANPGKLNYANSGFGLRRILRPNCSSRTPRSMSCRYPTKARRRHCRI